MSSLTDLLNPTFFMFLGILLLFVALLVVYFETKARDQNHKITSMLSLVSSLAEELNSVKIGLNNLTMMRGGSMPPTPFMNHFQNSEQNNLKDFNEIDKLIAVSDDDEDDDEDMDSDDEDDDDEDDDDDDEEDDDDLEDNIQTNNEDNEVKVLKINLNDIQDSAMTFEEIDNLNDLDELEDLEQFDSDSDSQSEFSKPSPKEIKLDAKEEIPVPVPSVDLKKINISDLEISKNSETIDYKKLSIQKLKAIVLEKGLSADTSKLNKPKLLQLLGVV